MKKLIILCMIVTYATSPIYSQETIENGVCIECPETDTEEASAYYGATRAAHWSAYVPISALIVAAICLGFADRNHKNPCKNDSFYHGNTIGTPPSLSSELGG